MKKTITESNRMLNTGLYLPPPIAHRHLLKPLKRYGKEKTKVYSENLIEKWYEP